MLRAVIFDFDGVISDSEVLHLRAFNAALGQYGIEISTKEYYTTYLGYTDVDCYKYLIGEGVLKIEEAEIPGLVERKKVVFEELAKNEGKLIEGVRDFIAMLVENNLALGICSGALLPEIEVVLEDAGLRDCFEVIISAEHITVGKPDPQGFVLVLERLNAGRSEPIMSSQCVVIEDSSWGLEAARAAGMHTVAVTNSYEAEQLGMAEMIVGNLSELRMEDLREVCG